MCFFIYENIISQTVANLQHQKREFILYIAGIEVSNMAHAMYATKDVFLESGLLCTDVCKCKYCDC